MTQSLQHVPLRRRAQRWGALIAAFAVAFMASVVGGTSPVAQATLVTMGIVTTSDGSGSTLDTATDNGIVATNESVTFEWNLSSQGTESVLVQTLPDCWEWDTTSFDLAGLNASNSQYTAAATANGTVLTVDVTIPDGSLTSVTFSGITAHPTGCAVDGSTYTPTLDATDDDGGTYSDAADELTVVSEERVELLKTDVFNGANQHATCDFGLGDEPCSFIRYRVTLYPPEGTDHLGAADLVLTEPVLLTDTYTITPPTGGPAVTDDLLEVVSVNPSTVTVSESGGVFSLTNLPQPIERVNIFFNIYIPDRQLSCCASVRIDNRIEADFMTANGAVVEPDPSNNATQNTLRATPAGLSFSAFHHKGVYVATSDPAYFTVNPRPSNSSWDRVSGSFVQTGSIIADSLLFRAEYVLGDSTEATLLQMHNFSDPSLQQIIDGVPPLVTYNNNTPLVAGTDYDTLTVEYTSGTDSANPENNTWEPSIAAAGGPEAVAGVRFTFTNLDLPQPGSTV